MAIPVVLVHGIFDMLSALPLGKAFGERPVIVPSMPGYGERRGEAASMDAAVNLLDEIISEEAHLVGHSVGGAIVMEFAVAHPTKVASIVNVEGNFTLEDAFWTSKLAAMAPQEAEALLEKNLSDVPAWLKAGGLEPTDERVALARAGFEAQPASTLQSMAKSVVEVTSDFSYLERVISTMNSSIPVHLIAGERSRDGWHVPQFVLERAKSFTVQPDAGHMMMLDHREAFLSLLNQAIAD